MEVQINKEQRALPQPINYSKLLITEIDVVNAFNTERRRDTMSHSKKDTPLARAESPNVPLTGTNLKKQRSLFFDKKEEAGLDARILSIEKKSYKQLNMITFNPPSYTYFDKFPLRPGIQFMKGLVEMDLPLSTLKNINFPLTLGLFSERFVLKTDIEKREIVYRTQFKNSEFIEMAKSEKESSYLSPTMPFLVLKGEDSPSYTSYKQAIPFYPDLKEDVVSKLEVNQLLQQYISPLSNKASFLRTAYYNRDCFSSRQTQVWAVSNLRRVDETKPNEYLKVILGDTRVLSLNQRSFVCYDNHGSFSVSEQKSLFGYQYLEEVCQQLLDVSLKAYKLKLKMIVVDFVKDCNRVFWFVGVKHFEVNEQVQFQMEIQSYAQQVVHCQMCRMPYRREEVRRSVNFKMLLGLKDHLNKRGIFILEKINPALKNEKSIYHNKWKVETCKVCDICYMLVIAENDLFQAQKQFALALSIPVADVGEGLTSISHASFSKAAPAFACQKFSASQFKEPLVQWRILFHMHCLYDLPAQYEKLTLELKAMGYTTTFHLDCSNLQQISNHSKLLINQLRLHYFFSEQGHSVEDFLEGMSVELVVRAPDGFAWKGASKPFGHYRGRDFDRVQNETVSIHLFGQEMKSCFLNGTVGLKKDQSIKAEDLELYLLDNVYIPHNDYYNCDPFPLEWLEIIQQDPSTQLQQDSSIPENRESFYTVVNPVLPNQFGSLSRNKSSEIKYNSIQSHYKDYFTGQGSDRDNKNRLSSQSMLMRYQSWKSSSSARHESSYNPPSVISKPQTSRFIQNSQYSSILQKQTTEFISQNKQTLAPQKEELLPEVAREKTNQNNKSMSQLQNKCQQSSKYISKILEEQMLNLRHPADSSRDKSISDLFSAPVSQHYNIKLEYFNADKKRIPRKRHSKSKKRYGSQSQRSIYQAYFGNNPLSKQGRSDLKHIIEGLKKKV